MLSKNDLPYDVTNLCYIGIYHTECCLFYKGVPILIVNYPFLTEDLHVCVGYIDNGYNAETQETERGYSLLVDIPFYDEKNNLEHVDHVYYGLFSTMQDLDQWLNEPYLLY